MVYLSRYDERIKSYEFFKLTNEIWNQTRAETKTHFSGLICKTCAITSLDRMKEYVLRFPDWAYLYQSELRFVKYKINKPALKIWKTDSYLLKDCNLARIL